MGEAGLVLPEVVQTTPLGTLCGRDFYVTLLPHSLINKEYLKTGRDMVHLHVVNEAKQRFTAQELDASGIAVCSVLDLLCMRRERLCAQFLPYLSLTCAWYSTPTYEKSASGMLEIEYLICDRRIQTRVDLLR